MTSSSLPVARGLGATYVPYIYTYIYIYRRIAQHAASNMIFRKTMPETRDKRSKTGERSLEDKNKTTGTTTFVAWQGGLRTDLNEVAQQLEW